VSGIAFTVRPMVAGDRRFVRETTLKVRQPRSGVTWAAWEAEHGPDVDRQLAEGRTVVADAGGGLLLGFATDALEALSMIYVKRDLRGNGIGLALLAGLGWGNDLPCSGLRVTRPTASFRKWADLHRIPWDAGDEEEEVTSGT